MAMPSENGGTSSNGPEPVILLLSHITATLSEVTFIHAPLDMLALKLFARKYFPGVLIISQLFIRLRADCTVVVIETVVVGFVMTFLRYDIPRPTTAIIAIMPNMTARSGTIDMGFLCSSDSGLTFCWSIGVLGGFGPPGTFPPATPRVGS